MEQQDVPNKFFNRCKFVSDSQSISVELTEEKTKPLSKEKNKISEKKQSKQKQAKLDVTTKIKEITKTQETIKEQFGGSLLFGMLTQIYEQVGNTRGQNSKQIQRALLKDLFKGLCERNPQDLIKAYWLSVTKICPDYEKKELGVGKEILTKAISKSTGKSQKQIRDAFQNVGDLGDVAATAKSTQKTMDSYFIKKKQMPPLTIDKVFNTFIYIAECKGNNSAAEKQNKIMQLLRQSKNEETKFIVRWIQGNLKINAGQKTMQQALIEALYEINIKNGSEEDFKRYQSIIKKAMAEYPNQGNVIRRLVQIGQKIQLLEDTCKITTNIPCKPMLAKPTKDISSILNRFQGKQFTCEFKYDGLRGQIHYSNGKVSIFSRNLENMTQAYPDICAGIQQSIKHLPIKNFIIDSEIVAINPNTKQLLPFQVLSTRSRKAAKINEIEVAVSVFTFDILHLNDQALTHLTLKQRREILKKLQENLKSITTLITSKECVDINQIDEFLQLAIKQGTQGLMIKDLGTTYACAKRSWDWVKLKKDYIDGLGDTLDVVPIGGNYGSGKRKGLFGAYLLAIYNPDLQVYESICKIGTGFSDQVLQAAFNFFKDKSVNVCPREYKVSSQDEVDVWFTPATVWEVKGADFQLSPVYTCGKGVVDDSRGIGLRFPRLLRIREDKKPNQGSDTSFVIDLYKQQAVVQNKNNKQLDEQQDDYY